MNKVVDSDEYVRRPTIISFQDMQIKFETDKFVTGSGKLICKRSSSIDLMTMGDDDSPITPQLPSPKDLESNNSFQVLWRR